MRLKIRCDGESEKFYRFFWELNKAFGLTSIQKSKAQPKGSKARPALDQKLFLL